MYWSSQLLSSYEYIFRVFSFHSQSRPLAHNVLIKLGQNDPALRRRRMIATMDMLKRNAAASAADA